mgnify:FL=1
MEAEVPYYDLEEARELLPWLREKHREYLEVKAQLEEKLLRGEQDGVKELTEKVDEIVRGITEKGVLIRDIDMGLFDFPAVINGRPAYLCWKVDEGDIMYFHYPEEGFRGRKRIDERVEVLPLR